MNNDLSQNIKDQKRVLSRGGRIDTIKNIHPIISRLYPANLSYQANQNLGMAGRPGVGRSGAWGALERGGDAIARCKARVGPRLFLNLYISTHAQPSSQLNNQLCRDFCSKSTFVYGINYPKKSETFLYYY